MEPLEPEVLRVVSEALPLVPVCPNCQTRTVAVFPNHLRVQRCPIHPVAVVVVLPTPCPPQTVPVSLEQPTHLVAARPILILPVEQEPLVLPIHCRRRRGVPRNCHRRPNHPWAGSAVA